MYRTVKRVRIYDLSSELTPEIRRKLTYNFKHEDDENYDELYHLNKLNMMLDEWIKEMDLESDPEREPKLEGFVDRCVIEADSGRLGYLSIDGEPGEWELMLQFPVEGESIFGLHDVTLYESSENIQNKEQLQRLVVDAEELVKETKRCVDLGWERKSRLKETEEHLEHLKKLLREVA